MKRKFLVSLQKSKEKGSKWTSSLKTFHTSSVSSFDAAMKILSAIIVLVALASWSETSNLRGNSCSKLDRCNTKSAFKTCSCAADCHLYGTCCQDRMKHVEDGSVGEFQCYSRRSFRPVFVKRSCSKDFKGNQSYKLACIEDDEDEMDVRNNLLVNSRESNVTYYNKHCAFCNNEPVGKLEYWNIVVHCPSHKDVDEYLVRRNLTFDQNKHVWGLAIEEIFLQCVVGYVPPSNVIKVKYCTPGVVKSCPEGYNKDISAKCTRYYAERKLKNSDTYFRNVHCAVCNDANIKDLECPGMSRVDDDFEDNDFHEMIEVVFTNGEWLDKPPATQFECSRGHVYDPGREKCRRLEKKEDSAPSELLSDSSPSCNAKLWIILLAVMTFLS